MRTRRSGESEASDIVVARGKEELEEALTFPNPRPDASSISACADMPHQRLSLSVTCVASLDPF